MTDQPFAEIPAEELGDPEAINDRVLLQRERNAMRTEAELRADVERRSRPDDSID